MIKSHAVEHVEAIIAMIEEKSDLRVMRREVRQLGYSDAAQFYAEHDGRPYFKGLIGSATSSPVCILLLGSESYRAVHEWRELMGSINPAEAEPWTIRAKFGLDDQFFNAVHGSDSKESFKREAELLFGVVPEITRSA